MSLNLRSQINRPLTISELDGNFEYLLGLIGTPIQLLTEVTHSELLTLIDNNELITGSYYLITDYETIYDQPDFDVDRNPVLNPVTKSSGVIEPLLCLAISSNKLDSKVYSPLLYPNDHLKYDIHFTETEINASAAKGRIIERIDSSGNRTDYDHRTVLFKRYETIEGSGTFNSYYDTGFSSSEFTTFANITVPVMVIVHSLLL